MFIQPYLPSLLNSLIQQFISLANAQMYAFYAISKFLEILCCFCFLGGFVIGFSQFFFSSDCRPPVGNLLAYSQPTVGGGKLFLTFTNLTADKEQYTR